MSNKVFLIYGPTAGGKSARALELAAARDGVIINADSMQLYDALHVLTAQPSKAEQEQAPHRLYAALSPAEKSSAAGWRAQAVAEIESAFASGQTPIIVGGTGFYIKTLAEGLSPIPAVPDDIRQEAAALQGQLGNPGFHEALAAKDPVMAARLHPNDTQRLIRAWEVLAATGRSLADWQAIPPQGPPAQWRFAHHFINPERAVLYERCNRRFDIMLTNGILDEVEQLATLIETGAVPADAPITHALGFHPLRAYLKGEISRDEAAEQAKTETRQYAKRQVTWFKNQLADGESGTFHAKNE